MDLSQIALIIALVISVVMHEMAHGYAANWLGDPTARLAGRLTPNPLVHLDPLMSVIIPGLLILSGSPILFGAAKPVPYNPYNFIKHQRWGEAIVAAAGPATNLILAVVFSLLIRFGEILNLSGSFLNLAFSIVVLNIFLALFNLLPFPPLDGSKIMAKLLPRPWSFWYNNFCHKLERNPFLSFGLLIFLFFTVLSKPLNFILIWITEKMIGL